MQKEYIDEATIEQYIQEYTGIDIAITTLQDRQYTIDSILRIEHNFVIGKDRL
jgi:hypothetical protein